MRSPIISFREMLSGPGGPRMQMELAFGGAVGDSHWRPQMEALLLACHLWSSLRTVRSESLQHGLDELVRMLNAQRRVGAPALPLPAELR